MQKGTEIPASVKLVESLRTIFYKNHLNKGSHYLEDIWLDDFFPEHAAECSRVMYPARIDTDEEGVIISVRQHFDVMDTGGRVIAQYESRFTPGRNGNTNKTCTIDLLDFKTQTDTPNSRMQNHE
jgi:hypothetical protein